MKELDSRQLFRTLWIVNYAFLVTPMIFIGICYFLTADLPEPASPDKLTDYVLAGIATLFLLASLRIPDMLLSKFRGDKGKVEHTRNEVLQTYFIASIMAAAVRESGAILGFVITFISGDLSWVIIFGVVTVLFGVLQWPRPGAVNRYLSPEDRY